MRVKNISIDGEPLTKDAIIRGMNEVFLCLRCGRSMGVKPKRGGVAYFEPNSGFRLAACHRCLSRKPMETLSLMQSALAQAIESDKMREVKNATK